MKEEGGRKKETGGRKKEEGGRKKEEGCDVFPSLNPNVFSKNLCVSRSHFAHSKLENTANYRCKFQIHANGLRLVKVPCTKYTACRQK